MTRSKPGAADPDDEAPNATDDAALEADDEDEEGEAESEADPLESAEAYSAALISDLTAHRAAALAAAVAQQPDAALVLIVHKLALSAFYSRRFCKRPATSCVKISSGEWLDRKPKTPDPENEAPFAALDRQADELGAMLPAEAADLFDWCVKADQATLLRLPAYCVGSRIDVRVESLSHNGPAFDRDQIVAGDKIARLLGPAFAPMREPSQGFFKRQSDQRSPTPRYAYKIKCL